MVRTLLALLLISLGTGWAQAPGPAAPAYDVVVIRLNKEGGGRQQTWGQDTTFRAQNVPLTVLLSAAYGIRPGLISGLPAWAAGARFDLDAKMVDPDMAAVRLLTREQREAMLAAVLEDRFQLKLHREMRMLPVYEIKVGKDGVKFKPATRIGPDGIGVHDGDMTATNVSLKEFADAIAQEVDRSVLDKTGLSGRYDLHVRFTPESVLSRGGVATDTAPSIFTALPEQLGLKLEAGKGPVETLVVDRAEMPGEN